MCFCFFVRVYDFLVCFDPAYLRTQAAAMMVSGCVSRFAMPSQPRWNGEGTPNQAGHGSTAARHPLEAAPLLLLTRSIQHHSQHRGSISKHPEPCRFLIVPFRVLHGSVLDAKAKEMEGRWPRPRWTCSRGLRQRRPRCQRPTTRHKICNALPSFLHHFGPLQLT